MTSVGIMRKNIINKAVAEFKKYFKKKESYTMNEEYPWINPIHTCVETTITTWYEGAGAIVFSGDQKGEDGNVIPFPVKEEEKPQDPEGAA